MSELFRGKILKRQVGDATEEGMAEVLLSGKLTALYFANSSNTQCVQFTQLLKKFYEELKPTNQLEILYLSDDTDEMTMLEHIKSSGVQWCFLPFGDPIVFDLIERYDLDSVPVLMPIKPDGTAIDTSATAEIQSEQKSAQDLVAKWASG